MSSEWPTRKGYYWNERTGKWYPSKRVKKERSKKRREEKIRKEVLEIIKQRPDKYDQLFAVSRSSAIRLGLNVYWEKCRKRHLAPRKINEKTCPVCMKIVRDLRNKRFKDARINLSKEEEIELYQIYEEARRLTKTTGVQYHVDHIRPLAAGGTHHPKNLQVITAEENLKKNSYYKGKRKTYSKREKREANKKFKVELKQVKLEEKKSDTTDKEVKGNQLIRFLKQIFLRKNND